MVCTMTIFQLESGKLEPGLEGGIHMFLSLILIQCVFSVSHLDEVN